MPRICQAHLKAAFFKYVVERDPVNAGRLHHDRFDPARLQPVGHPLQICCPTAELLHRLRIAARGHGHVVTFVVDINACHVSVHDLQSRVFGIQAPLQISALLAIQLSLLQPLERVSLWPCHLILSLSSEWTGSGSAGNNYTISPTGSSSAFFKDDPPPITESPLPKSRYTASSKASLINRP